MESLTIGMAKCRDRSDLRGSASRLRSPEVLVDQAAEYLPAWTVW